MLEDTGMQGILQQLQFRSGGHESILCHFVRSPGGR